MNKDPASAMSELRGYLHAFALFNDKSDHQFSFFIEVLPHADDVDKAIRKSFGAELEWVRVQPIQDWEQEVIRVLTSWLFHFQEPYAAPFMDKRKKFSLANAEGREPALKFIMDRLRPIIECAFRVQLQTKGWYECQWDDIVLQGESERYLLHLGVSD